MAERFTRLRSIVEDALDVPASDLDRFLAEACGDDEELLAEAKALLATQPEPGFLEPPPAQSTSDGTPDVPGYRIVHELGRGGMGVVYEAEQQTPRRRVALKLQAGTLHSEASLRRFRYETEILGALKHPGIAAIHDAGILGPEARPTPWFAMELVDGAETLHAHAETNALDTRRRIELFLSVLDAVEHGHRRGVIHRDLKPENVLVGVDGRPKVIDFGVARVADPDLLQATLETQLHEMVGTLGYMSPEQAGGTDVDTRTDVYALGVMLFELLSGALPIDVRGTDLATSMRRILEDAPRRIRALVPALDRDLDAILYCALEKDPSRRYASAGAFADDLRRHLAGDAIVARPPSAWRQLRLFGRRHKVWVAAGTLVAATLVTAVVVSLRFAFTSRTAEQAAEAERGRFERLYRSHFLQNIDLIARDAEEVALLNGGGPVAQRMIEEAVGRLEALERGEGGTPEFQLRLADAYLRLSGSLGDLGRAQEPTRALRERAVGRAEAIAKALLAADAEDAGARRQEVACIAARAAIEVSEGRFDAAHAHSRKAVAASDALGLDTHDEVRIGIDDQAALIGYRRNRPDEALPHATRVVEAVEALVSRAPDDPTLSRRLASGLRLRAEILRTARRFKEAHADLVRCVELRRGLVRDHPKRVTYRLEEGSALLALGLIHMARRQPDDAERIYANAYEVLSALYADAPQHLAVALEFGRALQGRGQMATAKALREHPKGSAERVAGLRTALESYERALEIAKQATAQRPDSQNAKQLLSQMQRMTSMTRSIIERAER